MNILLLTVDSLRHDILDLVSPRSAPWYLRGGRRFPLHFSCAPYTPCSVATILTGQEPFRHGIRGFYGCRMNPGVRSIAERLREKGYYTIASVGCDLLHRKSGFARGFDCYIDDVLDPRFTWDRWSYGTARETARRVEDRLAGVSAGRKVFLWVHLFDIHSSGTIGEYAKRLEETGEPVRRIGELLGLGTSIVVTSDHGEYFEPLDGRRGHRHDLGDSLVRVPLVVHSKLEVAVPSFATSHLDLAGLLVWLADGEGPPPFLDREFLYMETATGDVGLFPPELMIGMRMSRRNIKAIKHRGRLTVIEDDRKKIEPGEHPRLVSYLEARERKNPPGGSPGGHIGDVEQSLRNLGYL